MVTIFSSGTDDDEEISDTGISNSVVPTLCGPGGLGRDGMGLRYDEIILTWDSFSDTREDGNWSRDD